MTDTIGTYSFLPWLRRGIANTITAADGAAIPGTRVTIPVDLVISGTAPNGAALPGRPIHRDIALFGPGDLTKVQQRIVVRMEPRPGITNFEPNYLAFVEFYEEDLPWRYTPAAPDPVTKRLRPWISLVVLAEGEFKNVTERDFADAGAASFERPGVITVDDLGLFPPAEQLWAWAHVHVNRSLLPAPGDILSDDATAAISRLEATLAENADHASSRLLCPRKLTPNTSYHAFVVPTFESGRLAGLGLSPAAAPNPTASAWAAYAGREAGGQFPYYHRWAFSTGALGDFEQLARLLRPRPVNPRVGQRDMDVQAPGSNLPGISNPALGGVLRLGGALQVPQSSLDPTELATAQKYENWSQPYPHPFQVALANLINLAADYESGEASDPDPVITPPLYGQWHALTSRLLDPAPPPPARQDNWVHDLNLDPRFRVAAAFGTEVVQKNQEDYMAAAWKQVGDVLEANRRIRLAHLAQQVALSWHGRHLVPRLATDPGGLLALTSPVLRRVLLDGITVGHQVAASNLGAAPTSAAMRRLNRPGSRIARRTFGAAPKSRPRQNIIERMAAGEIRAADPKVAPKGALLLPNFARLSREVFARRGLDDRLGLLDDRRRRSELVGALPRNPNYRPLTPPWDRAPDPVHGERDSEAGERFKEATRAVADLITATSKVSQEPPRPALPVRDVIAAALDSLHPNRTIPRRTLSGLRIPERLRPLVVERFKEAMAYPEIDVPMYKPLVDISSELFLPNLNLVEQNSVTLLETNQRFIEAYLVGLNHEFARELLWREYPTDQRGSYFRQFWDPTAALPVPGETPQARRERLRDIPPLHLWSQASDLGDHDNREASPGTAEEEVVLVIRGELLKRYPTAVIYAQRAEWVRRDDGTIDPTAERVLVELTSAEETNPPPTKLRTPLYEAKVDPDIYFFGFDLTATAARGETGEHSTDDPGWFFVIQERPGEPRFGFDIERTGALNVWNDFAWADVLPANARFVPVGTTAPSHILTEPTAPDVAEKRPQWQDDRVLSWGPNMQSSEVAYITYQAPVQVAIHAREMLRG
ncbi:hypothetical protein [Microvirga massiliensis]|uniref:hypothetical protein n=1 Tax=Microvirga massiliensis TaxID=1033741 RepID=UPI00062B8CFE|nr:hypothetical protein [Microvirga massiliensis]